MGEVHCLHNGSRHWRHGIAGEVGGGAQDPWGGWEGSACNISMFALTWIKGVKGIKVSSGGGDVVYF